MLDDLEEGERLCAAMRSSVCVSMLIILIVFDVSHMFMLFSRDLVAPPCRVSVVVVVTGRPVL